VNYCNHAQVIRRHEEQLTCTLKCLDRSGGQRGQARDLHAMFGQLAFKAGALHCHNKELHGTRSKDDMWVQMIGGGFDITSNDVHQINFVYSHLSYIRPSHLVLYRTLLLLHTCTHLPPQIQSLLASKLATTHATHNTIHSALLSMKNVPRPKRFPYIAVETNTFLDHYPQHESGQ